MLVSDYGVVGYMYASPQSFTRHTLLYELAALPCRPKHWRLLIYKAILGLLPLHRLTFIKQKGTGL